MSDTTRKIWFWIYSSVFILMPVFYGLLFSKFAPLPLSEFSTDAGTYIHYFFVLLFGGVVSFYSVSIMTSGQFAETVHYEAFLVLAVVLFVQKTVKAISDLKSL